MHVNIKRIDPTLPLPEYHTKGACAFDLYARIEITIPPHGMELVPVNFVIKVPEGTVLFLASRSSTPKRKGLMVGNGMGIIDQDYCGNDDELNLVVHNTLDTPVIVERGERIGQALFLRVERGDFQEVASMDQRSRGGFGTTGTHVNIAGTS